MKVTTVIRRLHPNYRKRRPHVPVDEDAMRLAAKEFGRRGGQARALRLTKQERSASASKAARARWSKRMDMLEAMGEKLGWRKKNETPKGE